MTTISAERISLRSPAALCCAVPHLLGFHPQRSVVLVWLADGSIVLTQRLDLPSADEPFDVWARAVWAHRGSAIADEVIGVLCSEESGDPGGGDLDPGTSGLRAAGIDALALAIRRQAERASTAVRDLIALRGTRWRSLLCADATCCPPEGRSIPSALRESVDASFGRDGAMPWASRDDVVASLARDPDEAAAVSSTGVLQRRRSMSPAARERWRDSALSNLRAWTTTQDGEATPPRAAHLLLGLRDIRVRDTLLWHLTRTDGRGLRIAQGRLGHLVRVAPEGETAPVATVAGLVLWLLGDGVRAAAACDRALADDPDYTLAHMLAVSVGAGLSPADWRSAMATLSLEACRHGMDWQPGGRPL